MADILNLNKFSNKKTFTYDDKEYTIRGMKVKELKPFSDNMKKAEDDDSKIDVMVEVLSKLTNMTKDQLEELEVGELTALISISQGGDPEKSDEGK